MKPKLIILTLFLVVSGLVAQSRGNMDMSPQNMDAVRIWKLTEVLELTEDQTVSFLPIVQIHERNLRDKQKELINIGKTAKELLEKEDLTQKEVDKILKQYTSKHAEMAEIKQEFIKSLPEYLTPKQQVIYIGFEARFRKDLRNFMKDRQGQPDQSRRSERKRK